MYIYIKINHHTLGSVFGHIKINHYTFVTHSPHWVLCLDKSTSIIHICYTFITNLVHIRHIELYIGQIITHSGSLITMIWVSLYIWIYIQTNFTFIIHSLHIQFWEPPWFDCHYTFKCREFMSDFDLSNTKVNVANVYCGGSQNWARNEYIMKVKFIWI